MSGISGILVLMLWWRQDPSHALDHTIALLIVTCPCALGLATPLAVSAAVGQAARAGILVKGGDALERLASAGRMWPDKTGTLTEGRVALANETARPWGFHGPTPGQGWRTRLPVSCAERREFLREVCRRREEARKELGYLPGSEDEKMSPWGQAVFDTLGAITTSEVVDEVLDRGMLEVLPLTHTTHP